MAQAPPPRRTTGRLRRQLQPPPRRPAPAWPLQPPAAPPELEQLAAIASELGRPWI